jgi:hypothetical protein
MTRMAPRGRDQLGEALPVRLPADVYPYGQWTACSRSDIRGNNISLHRVLRFFFPFVLVALSLAGLTLAATPPAPAPTLPAPTVAIGRGGADGFLAVDSRGQLHVIFGGKYRTGPAPGQLGPEEAIAGDIPVHGVRIASDAAGRPHVVFSNGATSRATQSYYTARIDGRWLPVEKFADAADFPERARAFVADIAVDEDGRALVSFWVSRPTEKRAELDNPSFYYRWRSRTGEWSPPHSLPAHWSSAPKVEYERGRGFFLLWQARNIDWRITGPVAAGGTFTVAQSRSAGGASLTGLTTVQNEGADFSVHDGVVIAAGNVREKFDGPVGVWASVGDSATMPAAVYLGGFPGTKRGDESGVHPVTTYDAATGTAFLTVLAPNDKRACFTVHRRGSGWQRSYIPILPDWPTPQGSLRQGPSVADLPGPGVVALVRDGATNWFLRTLRPDDTSTVEWNTLGVPTRIGSGITPGIAVDARGTVHIVTMHEGAIVHRQQPAGGEFGSPEIVPAPEGRAAYNAPHVVCDDRGTVHLVFERDFTGTSRKAWYTNRHNGVWKPPLLAIERHEPERRVNYPRLSLGDGVAWVSAFVGGGSTIVKVVDPDSAPRVSGRIDTPLWVAHVFPRSGEVVVVGRAGAGGHKLERYSAALERIGEPLLLSRGSPTKTFEPTATVIDAAGVIHIVGVTAQPVQKLWYANERRAAADMEVILGPDVGENVGEHTYPVMQHDRGGRLYVSYRDDATGEARLTVFDEPAGRFLPPVTIAPATTRRLRWNPHLAAAPEGGVQVVWEDNGEVFVRTAGVGNSNGKK